MQSTVLCPRGKGLHREITRCWKGSISIDTRCRRRGTLPSVISGNTAGPSSGNFCTPGGSFFTRGFSRLSRGCNPPGQYLSGRAAVQAVRSENTFSTTTMQILNCITPNMSGRISSTGRQGVGWRRLTYRFQRCRDGNQRELQGTCDQSWGAGSEGCFSSSATAPDLATFKLVPPQANLKHGKTLPSWLCGNDEHSGRAGYIARRGLAH